MEDPSFEDELLEVARWSKQTPAREGGGRGGRSRRQNATVASSSEDESDRGRDDDDDEMEIEDLSEREQEEEPPEEDVDEDNAKKVDEDEDSSDDGGRQRLRKKAGATGPKRVPMKTRNNTSTSSKRRRTRSESEDDDDDDESDSDDDVDKDGYNSELSFGSDLYKDKEDRRMLMELTELEREMILHERGEKRDNYLERRGRLQKQQRPEEAEQEQKKQKAKKTGRRDHKEREPDRERERDRERAGVRGRRDREEDEDREWEMEKEREERHEHPLSSAPPAQQQQQRSRVTGELSSALKALAKKRAANEKRGRRSRRMRSPTMASSSEGSERGEEEEEEEEEEERSTSAASLSRSPRSRSRSRSRSRGRSEPLDSDEDERRRPEPEAEFADLQRVVVRRSTLAKWFMEPFFEDTITGCLVRLLVGADANNKAQYRLVEVVGVDSRDPSKTYMFENRLTSKFLDVKFGESCARWQMTQVSNSPVMEKEVRDWFKELDRVGIGRWTVAEVQDKCQAIAKVATFKYTPEAVRRMVMEKRQTAAMEGQRPRNLAMERDRLHKALDMAVEAHDTEEEEKLNAQLRELEAYAMAGQVKESKAVRLAHMNKRNKAENFQKSGGGEGGAGDNKDGNAEDLHDPFSRRWTRSQNYYKKPDLKNDEEEGKKAQEEGEEEEAGDGVAREKKGEGNEAAAAAEEVAGELLEGSLVDATTTTATTALFVTEEEEQPRVVAVHKFELPINLDLLERYGYASGVAKGIMARKRRLEAVYGVRVPPLDPRQRRVKLTIDDYQRRQQLK